MSSTVRLPARQSVHQAVAAVLHIGPVVDVLAEVGGVHGFALDVIDRPRRGGVGNVVVAHRDHRRRLAAAHAGCRNDPDLTPIAGAEFLEQRFRAHHLAGQAVADADSRRRRRFLTLHHNVKMGVKSRHLVDLGPWQGACPRRALPDAGPRDGGNDLEEDGGARSKGRAAAAGRRARHGLPRVLSDRSGGPYCEIGPCPFPFQGGAPFLNRCRSATYLRPVVG